MNNTKRKFNALLNNLGNKSSTSLSDEASAGPTTTIDAQAKKRRVVQPLSRATHATSFTRPPLSAATSNVTRHRSSKSTTTSTDTVEKPKYAPWDRTAFLERLSSFSNLIHWTPKPAKVNEVEWAKRGWVCQKDERVRCCLCNIEILVGLNKKEEDGKEKPVYVASQIEDALVERYATMIVTSHADNCLWRQRGCDESIFKIPLNHAPSTIQAIRERYDSLLILSKHLPFSHNIRTPDDYDLDTMISYLPTDFFQKTHTLDTTETETIPVNRVALTMALFGWRGRANSGRSLGAAHCESCFRNLGLWLFKSKEVDDSGTEIVGASMHHLDVAEEHRDYCPWRNAKSQDGGGNTPEPMQKPAWEVVARMLKNDHYLRRAGTAEVVEKKKRPATAIERHGILADPLSLAGNEEDEDAKSIREEKEKERWARLKRVKSLFGTRDSKKLQRAASLRENKPA